MYLKSQMSLITKAHCSSKHMSELIYYVDTNDQPTGETQEKYAAHNAHTKLHAAFSCYIFNDKGQFLVTQRAFSKKVWPGVWTNSCCGHPAPGESRTDAITRRLQQELGMTAKNLQLVLPDYTYITPSYNGIIEYEFCPVYVALATSIPKLNPNEVEAYFWMDWQDYVSVCEADGDSDAASRDWMSKLPTGESRKHGIWSWWCKDQLKLLKDNELLANYLKI